MNRRHVIAGIGAGVVSIVGFAIYQPDIEIKNVDFPENDNPITVFDVRITVENTGFGTGSAEVVGTVPEDPEESVCCTPHEDVVKRKTVKLDGGESTTVELSFDGKEMNLGAFYRVFQEIFHVRVE